MPTEFVSKVIEVCSISRKEAEDKWNKAKEASKEKGFSEGSKAFYAYTTGVFKNMLGDECKSKLEESVAADMFPGIFRLSRKLLGLYRKAYDMYLRLLDAGRARHDALHVAASTFNLPDRDFERYLMGVKNSRESN